MILSNNANFKIWYDAGNIIYYTGKDPLAELEPIARHITGICATDCPAPKGEVMSQFGIGKVDFKAVFAKLKSVGFSGPIMVEGIKVGYIQKLKWQKLKVEIQAEDAGQELSGKPSSKSCAPRRLLYSAIFAMTSLISPTSGFNSRIMACSSFDRSSMRFPWACNSRKSES